LHHIYGRILHIPIVKQTITSLIDKLCNSLQNIIDYLRPPQPFVSHIVSPGQGWTSAGPTGYNSRHNYSIDRYRHVSTANEDVFSGDGSENFEDVTRRPAEFDLSNSMSTDFCFDDVTSSLDGNLSETFDITAELTTLSEASPVFRKAGPSNSSDETRGYLEGSSLSANTSPTLNMIVNASTEGGGLIEDTEESGRDDVEMMTDEFMEILDEGFEEEEEEEDSEYMDGHDDEDDEGGGYEMPAVGVKASEGKREVRPEDDDDIYAE
jgi:hypothetical protein